MKYLWVLGSLFLLLLSACTPAALPPTATTPPTSTQTTVAAATTTPVPTATTTLAPTPEPAFSFAVTTDMSVVSAPEYIDYPNFFAALLGDLKQSGPGDFMVSPGDIIPAEGTDWTIDQVLGEDYLWFPLPGNHDFDTPEFSFLQNYDYDPNGPEEPNLVNPGPESCPHTTYSFDYQNAHFVALNVYCNKDSPWGIDGSITDTLYDWLAADLAATDKTHIFIFGHEPAFPQPDVQTGYANHIYESLDQYQDARDRFWDLLKTYDVRAYFCGHTHNYNASRIDGVWQINAGQAMGVRAAPSPGTYLLVYVEGEEVTVEVYRGEAGPGFDFLLYEEVQLTP
jgi:hypothetical protein